VTLRMRAVSHSVIDAPAAGVKAAGRGAQPSRGRHKTAIANMKEMDMKSMALKRLGQIAAQGFFTCPESPA